MGIAAVYTLSLIGTDTVFNNEQQRISNSFFSCTLALNAVCTGACLCFSSDIFLSLPGLHQVSLRSASGQRSVRHATPRWAPTFLMSPSSSLNLVHFIPPLSIRLQRSHMYLTATGAIYVAVLVLEVWTFAVHSFLFNIFLDMVSRNRPLRSFIPADMLFRRPRL